VVNIGTGGGNVDALEQGLVDEDVVAPGPADGLLANDASG